MVLEAELQKEKEARNYIRAAHLAEQAGLLQEACSLRKAALRQFLVEFNNFDGAAELIREYGMTESEVHQLIQEILSDSQFQQQRIFCFDKGKPSHLSIVEQIRRFSQKLTLQK
jgi:Mor family transcriptional regulator